MPSKSMSPMPMQSKIGEASLKFGPDWLRALSSDSSTSSTGSPWSSGSGGGGGTALNNSTSGNSPANNSGSGGNGFGSNINHHSGYHQSHSSNSSGYGSRSYSSSIGGSNNTSNSSGGSSASTNSNHSNANSGGKYKKATFCYSREEVLSLYDRNLQPPDFLPAFSTLFVEKIQPPLAFSQPSEEELRIWHFPQPQSSRQSAEFSGGPPVIGRGGYSIRGRGSGLERGRGRGRGGYYGSRPTYDEEDRVTFSRPRNFERSVSTSAHERPWAERNGTVGVGGGVGSSQPEEAATRGGGNWRNRERESFGSKRSEDDDGWRKPRWRRDEDDEGQRSSSSRRLHKSWSDDGTHDNLPEWAKDGNDEREGGTFDASGAFHDEDGYSAKSDAFERSRRESERSKSESEPLGSQNDTVQKKTPDRVVSKTAIPPSVQEEREDSPVRDNRNSELASKQSVANLERNASQRADKTSNIHAPSKERRKEESNIDKFSQPIIAKSTNSDTNLKSKSHHGRSQLDEEHFLSMTQEADSLVAKLIEDDGISRNAEESDPRTSSIPAEFPVKLSHSSSSLANHSGIGPSTAMSAGLDRTSPAALSQTPPTPSLESMETWYYRDPQGNVQGPFSSHEMHQWFLQGYFTGGLLLRRDCDKIFITLHEMAKLYDRNPFELFDPDFPPPAPILEPSALDPHSADGILQAQYHQRQQQILQQQNLLREQKYLLSMNQSGQDRWQSAGGVHSSQQTQSNILGQGASELTPSQVQAQMILNIVKNAGGNVDPTNPNPIEHLQALFTRQTQLKGGEPPTKAEFMNSLIQSQANTQMEQTKSPTSSSADPMQSLIQQLSNMTGRNPQSQVKPVIPIPKSETVGTWGSSQPMSSGPQMQTTQIPWGPLPQQSQNCVWDYRDQVIKMQQQKIVDEEIERRKKQEEEKERMRLLEEDQRRREEQKRLELEEQERRKAALIEEQQFLLKKKQEEMMKQQQAAELARRREEERLEEEKRKALMLQKQQEEMQAALQRHQAEMERKAADQRQRLEQQRLEQQRLEQQLREQQEREEKQRKLQQEHEERLRREQREREEQHRREQEEIMRREREEQQRREQQSKFSWNPIPAGSTLPIVQTRTLLEIQQEEAVKQQEEIVRQQVLKKKQLEQQQEQQRLQQQNSSFKWAQAVQPAKPQIKSFAEIQAEEAAKLAKQQEKDREQRAVIQQQVQQQQVWNSSMSWATRASLNAPSTTSSKSNGGAWGALASSGGLARSASSKSQFPHVSQQQPTQAQKRQSQKESDDNFMKLFHEHGLKHPSQNQQSQPQQQDDFTRWCYSSIDAIGNNVDIPVFISFLKEVESPYEVNDYVRSYLGDGRDAREFAKDFLEKRSRWKHASKGNKDAGGFEDNLCRPASAVNPANSEFQEVKIKGKKGKKGKMQKIDSKNLGFTTTANKRDYGEDSSD